MPKRTEKEKIINALILEAVEAIVYEAELDSEDDGIEEILDELDESLNAVMTCPTGYANTLPKSEKWRDNILTMLDDNRFRQMLRVSREEFSTLVGLIQNDEEFTKAHSPKQFSVELQLAIVLYRLGSSGEGGSIRKIATLFGIGDGGTILVITNRVFKALLKLQTRYIYWPDESERLKIVSATIDELPYCIGYIDGTEIKFAESPVKDHTSYFSRNHIYSLKAQVVCDYKLKIRHVVVGHPGSWHDARIYRNSSLFKRKEQYFSSQQRIAGDSAYPLSDTLITPFRSNARQLNRGHRISFNLRHSKYRVRIEHCFGVIKERFGSLKELRIRLSSKESHKLCCDWFIVCCILHNILVDGKENFFLPTLEKRNEEYPENVDDVPEIANIGGEMKRNVIYSLMCD